jgi:hypothetical protein
LDNLLLSLFACPKSNQKRQPAMKQPIAGTAFSIWLLGYCGEGQWSPDVVDLLDKALIAVCDQP